MFVDSHSHVNFKAFEDDYSDVLKRARDAGVVTMLVGTQIRTSHRAVEMAQEFPKTFAAVGLHPVQLYEREIVEEETRFKSPAEDFDHSAFEDLARLEEVKAIGECGIDYYHIAPEDDQAAIVKKQVLVLNQQIDLANQEKLPVILHSRGSREDQEDVLPVLYDVLKNNTPKYGGVLHSYPGDWQWAKTFMEMGLYLGFNGIITFDKTGRTELVIAQAPLERLVIETDAPYLTPVPYRGKRNEPAYVIRVADKIAEIKRLPVESVADKTTQNAKTLFKLSI